MRPCTSAQAGSAAVEFAATVLVLALVLGGLAELGRAFWVYDALAKSTRDAARVLATTPLAQLPTAAGLATTLVRNAAGAARVHDLDAAAVSVQCTPVPCASATQAGDVRRVTVAVRHRLALGEMVPFFAGPELTLAPQTTMAYLW